MAIKITVGSNGYSSTLQATFKCYDVNYNLINTITILEGNTISISSGIVWVIASVILKESNANAFWTTPRKDDGEIYNSLEEAIKGTIYYDATALDNLEFNGSPFSTSYTLGYHKYKVEKETLYKDYLIKGSTLTSIADAIRAKTGGTAEIPVTDMATQIGGIVTETEPVLQELTITENGEYLPSAGYDGFLKVIANVENSPLPIEVSTEEEMTALLTAENVGGVYKFTGTTGTYENGALYVVEAELISFTIYGTEYQAESGMTWSEWVESEYNTGEWYETDGNIAQDNTDGNTYAINGQSSTDIIEPYDYSIILLGTGSNEPVPM